jgi:hypothetical protein
MLRPMWLQTERLKRPRLPLLVRSCPVRYGARDYPWASLLSQTAKNTDLSAPGVVQVEATLLAVEWYDRNRCILEDEREKQNLG